MVEWEREGERLWSFPEGLLGHDDSLKGFRVEATDGHADEVWWASYAAGESYLVVSHSTTSTRRIALSRPGPSSGSARTIALCRFT